MSRVGLVLGGGGVTGAAFHFGSLLALEMATGWDPNSADLVVGTSSGAVVGAVLRSGQMNLDTLVGDAAGHRDLHQALSGRIYRRRMPTGVIRWIRYGLIPGIAHPGIQAMIGSPALHTTDGIVDWLRKMIGDAVDDWPQRPMLVAAYELESRRLRVFGTEGAPGVSIGTAVAASSAVPMVYQPVAIDGRRYVDGGVASATSADLVFRAGAPLDLVVVIAPMAPLEPRSRARVHTRLIDRRGTDSLEAEVTRIRKVWPVTEVVVLRPDAAVLAEAGTNPLSTATAVPAFLRTLHSMRAELAGPDVWPILERHLLVAGHR